MKLYKNIIFLIIVVAGSIALLYPLFTTEPSINSSTISYSKIRDTYINLNWTQASDTPFESYSVYRSTSLPVSLSSIEVFNTTDSSTLSYNDTGLTANTQYYYAVLTYANHNSAWGNTLNVSTYSPNSDYIMTIGDSITKVPSNYVPRDEYPVKLNTSLNAVYGSYTVTSVGINSEKSDAGRARFIYEIQSYHPDLVIIMYGTNDLMQSPPRNYQDISDDIFWMANESVIRGIKPYVLLTIACKNDALTTSIKELDVLLEDKGTSYGITTIDTFDAVDIGINNGTRDSLNTSNYVTDAVHPNAIGMQLIADKIYNQIQSGD